MDLFKGDMSSALSGLFTNMGLRKVLKTKVYQALNMEFPLVSCFIDHGTGLNEIGQKKNVHTTTLNLKHYLIQYGRDCRSNGTHLRELVRT